MSAMTGKLEKRTGRQCSAIATQQTLGWSHVRATFKVSKVRRRGFISSVGCGSPQPLQVWKLGASAPTSLLGSPELGSCAEEVSGPSLMGDETVRATRKSMFFLALSQLCTRGQYTCEAP